MKRRDFIAATALAGAVPLTTVAAAAAQRGPGREYYELRKYQLLGSGQRRRLDAFLRDVALPAWNRLDINPVGVFTVVYGPNRPTVYVLLPHKSLESFAAADTRLMADADYLKGGADFLDLPPSDPPYVRIESSLMAAFMKLPSLVVPEGAAEQRSRIFELRTYESHNKIKAKKKIEMFNEGGEIAIFLKTGLKPVFFGETLIGPNMPNLTYMLVFDDMVQRDASWPVFSRSPEWRKLSADPAYADTVSNITDIFLRPARYSQI
ncbi:NIPSNAP family protein [Candidatus Neomarinimicrobiota bacterium]